MLARFSCLLLLLFLCLTQESHRLVAHQHAGHSEARNLVAPIIDGAKTPERIPDETAVKLFLLAVVEPQNPTGQQLARIRAKLLPIGLSEDDKSIFIREVCEMHPQLAIHASRIDNFRQSLFTKPNPITRKALVEEHRQIDALAASTYREILGALSLSGTARLVRHIGDIKTRMRIIPPPKM